MIDFSISLKEGDFIVIEKNDEKWFSQIHETKLLFNLKSPLFTSNEYTNLDFQPYARCEGIIIGKLILTRNNKLKVVQGGKKIGFENGIIRKAKSEEITTFFFNKGNNNLYRLGKIVDVEPSVPVLFNLAGFTRHTLVCGQSGSGKSFALSRIVEYILLKSNSQIILLDPNSDFRKFQKMRTRSSINKTIKGGEISEIDYLTIQARFNAIKSCSLSSSNFKLKNKYDFFVPISDLDFEQIYFFSDINPDLKYSLLDCYKDLLQKPKNEQTISNFLTLVEKEPPFRFSFKTNSLGTWGMFIQNLKSIPIGEIIKTDYKAIEVDLGSLDTKEKCHFVSYMVLKYIWALKDSY